MVKDFTPSTVTAGDGSHTFTITVTNDGTFSDADNLTITDSVDSRLVVSAVSGTAGVTCAAPSQSISCTLASLAAGASATVTVTYSVAADVADATVSNTASAASDEDTDTGSADLAITNDVDLTVVKDFAPSTVTAGDGSHNFTITVTNDGTFSDADNLTITDSVDSRLVVSAVSGTAGVTCAAPSQSISCTLASLAAGASATVTVTYSVAADVADATVSNTASAASDEDTDTGSADLAITNDADLDITKDGPTTVVAGTSITYIITVTNSGPSMPTPSWSPTPCHPN